MTERRPRLLEARVGRVASHELVLALPNALIGFAVAAAVVLLLLDTRMRRVLA